MTSKLVIPLLIALFVAWRLYFRARRNFGRQPIRNKRTWTRMGILCAAVVALGALGGMRSPLFVEWLIAGLVAGVALGWLGLRLTRFEISDDKDCYMPNPWIGAILTALLIAKLLYDFVLLRPELEQAAAGTPTTVQYDPYTMAFWGLWCGYYVAYYAGLLLHQKHARANAGSNP